MADTEDEKPAAPAAAPAATEEPPAPKPEDSPIYRRVMAACADRLAEGSHIDRGDLLLKTTLSHSHELLAFLRDDPELRFDYLPCVTAVDYPEREARFDVVWTLMSTHTGALVNVVAEAALDAPAPSVVDLWLTAGWHERETYDMFGIRFDGNPDMRRILLPEWWEGFPLRKDYPVEGRGEHELVVEECLRPQM